MKEQSTDAYEIAYTGTFGGKTTLGLAAYQSDTNDNINFTYLYPAGTPGYPSPSYYSVTNPARGSRSRRPRRLRSRSRCRRS